MTATVSLDDVPATTTNSGSISVSSIAGIAGGIGGVLCIAAAASLIVWRRRKHAVAPQAAEVVKSGAPSKVPPSQSQYANIALSRSEVPTYDVGQVAVYSIDNDDKVYAKGHLTIGDRES
jgi:type IV secretory pathway TrbF-like protein